MALLPVNRNVEPLPRNELETFLKNFRQIKAFEQLQLDGDTVIQTINLIIEMLNAVLASPIVTASAVSVLENERILQGDGQAISVTFGPDSAAVSLDDTAIIPTTYGSDSEAVAFTVDQQGRLTHAEAFSLNTDNIAEGATNLYFTDARARESLSAGTGISYDDGTGVISLADTTVTPGNYGTSGKVAQIVVNARGQITTAGEAQIAIASVIEATPATDGTYPSPTSITIKDGVITAIS